MNPNIRPLPPSKTRIRLLTPRVMAGFVMVVGVLVVTHFLGIANLRTVYDTSESVAHTSQVKAHLEQLLGTLVDAETGGRGFVITGDASYLEPYERARSQIASEIERVRTLTADNREQQIDLDRLAATAGRKLAEVTDAVTRRREAGFDAARAAVADGNGKRFMDEARRIVARMESREDARLAAQTTQANQSFRSALVARYVTSGFALLAVIVLFVGTRRFGAERLRATENAERLRVTLASIGDAVITTDTDGRVTRANAVAQSLTGWTETEAIGRRFADVFVIVDEDSRHRGTDPVERVLRERTVVGFANHTLLVGKDGREIPIDDSAAPIHTDDGELTGVVIVFRDITERRRAERDRAVMLEREQAAHVEAERVAEELRQLQTIVDTGLSTLDRDTLVRELLARVRSSLQSDTATMLLVDGSGAGVIPVASVGMEEELEAGVRIPLGEGIAGRIAVSDRTMIVDDIARLDVVSPILRTRVKSLVGTPLKVDGRLLGVLQAGSTFGRAFTESDAHLLSLAADRIAMALERAQLHETERTARLDAETATQQLRVALEAGGMGTWEYSIRTGVVTWSTGLEEIHGYAPGTFPGTFDAFHNEIHPDDRERVVDAIRQAVAERLDHHIEYRIVGADGSVRWVEGRGKLFLNDEQQPDRMVGVCVDVTERHRDIAERRKADERFRLAVDAAPATMLMVDHSGTIVLANAQSEQLLGYTREEIVGQPVDRFVPHSVRGRHAEHRRHFLAESRQRPMGAGRDLHVLHKNGTEVPVEIGLSPIQTSDGLFVLAAVTDISERKAIEQARADMLLREQTARGELERASRLKDEFLAVLSHELRTPLSAVLGYTQLLRTGRLSADRIPHALNAIHRNAQAQARLIESLLDLSRIIAGKLELDPQRLDVAKLVDAAVDVVRPDADAKAIKLDVEMRSRGLSLVGDGGRLQQVLWNLLSNAVKFTPQGGRISVRTASDRTSHLQIEVSDTGQGISPEFLPYVFERFKQAENHKERSRTGLGLGLAVAREIVEAHGGTIVAASAGDGRGSTFTVTLPVAPAAHVAAPATDVTHGDDAALLLEDVDVLVVDDDDDMRDLLCMLLDSRGARVHAVASASAALKAIAQHRPDVLLADLRMPDEDGYGLIRRLRSREGHAANGRLPAIAVTADASSTDREKALAAGYDWHLGKPIEPATLLRAIARFGKTQHA